MNCPHCRVPLVDGARFCPACGKATAPTESGTNWPAAGGAPDLAGKEIAGRYRIIKKLGEGGMGAVYRGEQISLKRQCAVKLLRPELGGNQMILQRFNAEAHAVAKLSHPNTVNIYDFGQDTDGSLFIAMEFIEGRSLREALQKEGPFSPQRALSIAMQVAASLSDAHSHSIVHRDLKPDNVMLQDRGRAKDVVRVLDFGIAKLRDDNRATQAAMTQAGDMLGTPQYMAPEQIRGEQIDGRTDIYALGCMIYEMVTARMPYEAPTVMAMLSKHLLENPVPPTQRRPELALPPAIDHLVLSAMAKDPNHRPATMDQFSEMVAGLLAQLGGDPNQTGGRPVPQAGGPSMAMGAAATPAAMGAFQPPTPPPMGGFQPPSPPPMGAPSYGGYQQPQIAPTAMVSHAPQPVVQGKKSNAAIFAIVGVLAVGGAGAGIYFATQGDDKKTAEKTGPAVDDPDDTTPDKPDPGDKPDPDEDDDTPAPPVQDHWGDATPSLGAGRPPAVKTPPPPPPAKVDPPATANVGTAMVPLPRGATLIAPRGFRKMQDNSEGIALVDENRGLAVAMAPLYAGTNDPMALARMYEAETGAKFAEKDRAYSAGGNRDVLAFTHEVSGIPVVQVIVLYISSSYRLAVVYQATAQQWMDEAFQKEVDAFFLNNVKLPATVRP